MSTYLYTICIPTYMPNYTGSMYKYFDLFFFCVSELFETTYVIEVVNPLSFLYIMLHTPAPHTYTNEKSKEKKKSLKII